VLTMLAMILYTLWYAMRVKADPSKSVCGISAEDAALAAVDASAPAPLTATATIIIGMVFATFALLAFSIVPWGMLLNNAAIDPYTEKTISSPLWWELGWWLPELSALFFIMAIVVGIVGRLGEEATANAFIKGIWGIHLTGVARTLWQWNAPVSAPTTLSRLENFKLGSRLMQTAWTTWNGYDGLAASSARPVVIREDGGLGTAGSCVLDAVTAHQ